MITGKRMIKVTVKPRAKRVEVKPVAPGHYRVEVTAAPEKGKANAAVVKAVARHLGVAPSRMKIIRGSAGKNKLIELK